MCVTNEPGDDPAVVEMLDSGRRGMAGSFGYEAPEYPTDGTPPHPMGKLPGAVGTASR